MLSFMASEFFRQSPMLRYPLIALALFMLVFFVVTLKTVLTRAGQYEGMARLPLEDGAALPATHEKETRHG